MSNSHPLIVAITGASGSIYGIRVLQLLRQAGIEAHLVLSKWGARTLQHETPYSVKDVQALAHTVYHANDEGRGHLQRLVPDPRACSSRPAAPAPWPPSRTDWAIRWSTARRTSS